MIRFHRKISKDAQTSAISKNAQTGASRPCEVKTQAVRRKCNHKTTQLYFTLSLE